MNNQVLEYHLQVPSNDFSAEPVNGLGISAANDEVQEEVQEEEPKANVQSAGSFFGRLKGNNFECVFAFVLFLFGILFMNKRSQRILGGGKQVGGGILKGTAWSGWGWYDDDCNWISSEVYCPSCYSCINTIAALFTFNYLCSS